MAKPRKARKTSTSKSIAKRLPKVAVQANKRIAKASAVLKKNRKTYRKVGKAILGIGASPKRSRAATTGDILRKGKSLLRRNAAALARFIAARYSPKAIAKYQDYAGRLRRSIRLRRQVVEIDDNTFRVRKYIVKTDTAGNNPYSCTCPDFSQFSDDDRNWLGSKAGPFNPCKHMMAVRDRDKTDGKWVCNDGTCTFDPLAVDGYASLAACNASRVTPEFIGGQCETQYRVTLSYVTFSTDIPPSIRDAFESTATIFGPIKGLIVVEEIPAGRAFSVKVQCRNSLNVEVDVTVASINIPIGTATCIITRLISVRRTDALPDNCGDAPPRCLGADKYESTSGNCSGQRLGCTDPLADNYDDTATVDDASCTY